MDNKKFEQLIDMIINENDEQARSLFHDIVVEKSREIYESMMDEEQMDENMGGQVGDLLDEIGHEEEGMTEEDDEFADIEIGDEEGDDGFGDSEMGDEDFSDEQDEAGLEDRVVDLEDKLDELMAEFEEIMGHEKDEEEMGGEEDFGDEESGDEESGDEEMMEETEEQEEEESLEESVQLHAVKGLYGSKIGGDNGDNAKSVALTKPKVVQTGAKPTTFSQGDEKGRAAPSVQSMSGSYKNAPGANGAKTETAPKPHTAQATGTNVKSPVAESKRTAKKIVK